MPTKDLRTKYGLSGTGRNLLNRAIRAECIGGPEVLAALEKIDFARIEMEGRRIQPPEPILRCLAHLRAARDAMEDSVRERYAMLPRSDRDDLAR